MRKAFRRSGIQVVAKGINGNADVTDIEGFTKAALAQVDKWDLDAVSDAFLIEGSVAWSYPEPISLEAIDQLPDAVVKPVLDRMTALYSESTPAALKN